MRGRLGRTNSIAAYLTAYDRRRLHIGAGGHHLTGWLNTDIACSGCVPLDATEPFPFEDATFTYVYSEHMIEHITWREGQKMLAECYRVMESGGRIRIATPDLGKLCRLVSCGGSEELVSDYTDALVPDATDRRAVFLINNEFLGHGHKFLYDTETLAASLQTAGFTEPKEYSVRVSDTLELAGLERHGEVMGRQYPRLEDVMDYFTLVVEALRP